MTGDMRHVTFFSYIFRWTESLKKVLKKGLKKVTELKKSTQKSNEAQKSTKNK